MPLPPVSHRERRPRRLARAHGIVTADGRIMARPNDVAAAGLGAPERHDCVEQQAGQ